MVASITAGSRTAVHAGANPYTAITTKSTAEPITKSGIQASTAPAGITSLGK